MMRWTQVFSLKSAVPELLYWFCWLDDIRWLGVVGKSKIHWRSNVISVYTFQTFNQGALHEKSHWKDENEMYNCWSCDSEK